MLKEIIKAIETELGKIPGIKKTGVYKYEFEEDSSWNPSFPCAFHSFNGFKPILKAKGGKTVSNITQVRIYGGDKSISEEIGLDFVEKLIDALDGLKLTVTIETVIPPVPPDTEPTTKEDKYYYNVEIADDGLNPYKYFKGMQSFTLDINIFQ